MERLQEIYEKIKFELDEQVKKETEEDSVDDNYDDEILINGENIKKNILGVRRDTKTAISGLAKKPFKWTVRYDTLKNVINDKIRGVTVSKGQAEEIFKVVKDILEYPENYEDYKSE